MEGSGALLGNNTSGSKQALFVAVNVPPPHTPSLEHTRRNYYNYQAQKIQPTTYEQKETDSETVLQPERSATKILLNAPAYPLQPLQLTEWTLSFNRRRSY